MSSPLPLITLPDFETLVVDRLELCNQAIGGLTVFKQPPVNALPPQVFPICYTLVGPMLTPIPIETIGAGQITVIRDYVVRVFGDPVGSTLDNSPTAGAQGLVDLLPWFNRFRQYFIGHPKLETTTLGALNYMTGQLVLLDGGLSEKPAPGGADHFAIDITLTIAMRVQVSTLA
jgi:hypothetical protein